MIVLCFGNSHSAGIELWEEQHIPNYSAMSEEDGWNSLFYNVDENERKDLTYTGFIKTLRPNWMVYNLQNLQPDNSR